MKLKKVLAVLFTCVMILTMSPSAFASETKTADLTEVTPYIIGIGDTQDKALTLIPNQNYTLFLDENKDDKDWFKWTNDTGENKFVSIDVILDGSRRDFRLGFIIDYGNGRKTDIVYTDSETSGNWMPLSNLYLPPGATVYAVVDHAPGKYVRAQYTLVWYLHDV
ncbi:hypothetical protein [Paenibacillus sp. 79R4]|uniref:hypothetical protein n=1 Tax=Paenibacillus sp. 79R4 TaxID=2212847 RepID=UPI0015C1A67F|nr:hypothetical protein [Paenibacillus sp. 79R4]